MAKQAGILKLEGLIGDLSFYKAGDVHLVRMKSGPSKQQVLTDPRFARTRENSAEFGRAVRMATAFRDELRTLLKRSADRKFYLRLNARMLHLLKADTLSSRGERKVCMDHLSQLQGMECNVNTQLGETFYLKERPEFDRSLGLASLVLPPMRVKDVVRKPPSATHVQLELTGLGFNPDCPANNQHASVQSAYLDLSTSQQIAPIELSVELLASAEQAAIILFGINYFQMLNGAYYPLSNELDQTLTIVEVDIPK